MKKQFEKIINAIEWEIKYQTTDGDHWQNLIDCLLVDDIAYNGERYIEALKRAYDKAGLNYTDALIQWIINEWLPYNGDCLQGKIVHNYFAPDTTLLYCAIDEIIVDFPSCDIKKPNALLINYINNKTDYYCTDELILSYHGSEGVAFTLSAETLVELIEEHKGTIND